MEAEDLWFDPLFLVVKGMQDKQMEVLECNQDVLRDGSELHRRSFQQQSNGMPKHIRPIMDSALVAMAMMQWSYHLQSLTLTTFVLWRQSNPVTYSRVTHCTQILTLRSNLACEQNRSAVSEAGGFGLQPLFY